ncbi:hypothetical protein Droror1_Dr00005842 [Drosera rotundifolia]
MGAEGGESSHPTAATVAEEEVVEGGGGEEVTVNVRCSNASKFAVRTRLGSKVRDLKVLIAQNCDVPADQQKLIYKGRILKDDQTLESYGLQADHTVHMVKGFASSAAPATPAPATAVNANPPTATAPNTAGALGGAGLGGSLFPGVGLGGLGGNGGSGLFGAGFPEFDQMQQQLTQNPNMMREIMNTPAIQSLMNNPELMRSLIMSNPQMREIIDRNPELGHILNDPSILRQTLETARNPELMREMMRNTDRAMSNIESSPEGFNMLRRMYENVQEPFLNATTMAGEAGNNLSSNPFATLLGNQGRSQPGNTANNPSTTGSDSTAVPAAPNANPLPNPWTNTAGATQTNPAARSNPASLPGLGALGSFPDLESMLGGAPDPAMLSQLMQNPAISQMMQSVLSNPQYMNQLFNMHPQLRAMSEMNPELLRQLATPEMMQQMLALQQTVLSQLNRPQGNQDAAPAGGVPGNTNNMGLEMLMNMFGGLGAGGLNAPPASNVPPEELYATQLSQLQEMGFIDTQENIRALQASHGNVHAAVEDFWVILVSDI